MTKPRRDSALGPGPPRHRLIAERSRLAPRDSVGASRIAQYLAARRRLTVEYPATDRHGRAKPRWGFPYPAAREPLASSPASPHVRACRPMRTSITQWHTPISHQPREQDTGAPAFWLVAVALSPGSGATGLPVCDWAGWFRLSVALGTSRSAASAVAEARPCSARLTVRRLLHLRSSWDLAINL
jgi:hypothetical protein